MAALVLSLLLAAAPVPRHLFPPPPPAEPRVGFRWYYAGDVLVVHEVRGDLVTFRCLTAPGKTWPPLDGGTEPNQQSRKRVLEEAGQYGRPLED